MGNLFSGNPKHFLSKIEAVRLLLPLCLPVPETTAPLVYVPATKTVTETGREVKPPQEGYGQQLKLLRSIYSFEGYPKALYSFVWR